MSAGAVLLGGIVLFVVGMRYLRSGERVKEVPVEVPVEVIRYIKPPPQAPAPVAPTPPPTPMPVPKIETVMPGPFDGSWQRADSKLPLFVLKQSGMAVSGAYAPANWAGAFGFKDGKIVEGCAEFAVADHLQQRLHFRFRLVAADQAEVAAWLTPEDALVMLNAAVKLARTPQQAVILRYRLEHEFQRLCEPRDLGTFYRLPDERASTGNVKEKAVIGGASQGRGKMKPRR
jgi:hypothetical protein